MGRLSGVVAVVWGLFALPAEAGQASATFRVGITIGNPDRSQAGKPVIKTYTWNAAAISVTKAGYQNPERLEAEPGVYWFVARKDGQRYRIGVSKTTGRIVEVTSA
jgi:hypothetical protein